ncbi:uncharacterized protein N0V89_009895 [Didymosphaeria variabile]|uniref:Uncharacterized protein n=1 Tax=Didymosphaeria variabile TaxID=1932322 RepID=A0A9W8XGH4_9PLEO|nr:uncharacterized protein N0V89_009895 [Didymosphaeria variabile]KAJ4348518.1 hypothetical protein N0V89_009895 [Didymosphaeria variabile]
MQPWEGAICPFTPSDDTVVEHLINSYSPALEHPVVELQKMRPLARGVLFADPSSLVQRVSHAARFQSSSASSKDATTATLSPRWLSDLKARIGKCIMFGIDNEQVKEAGQILHDVNYNWKDLVAGTYDKGSSARITTGVKKPGSFPAAPVAPLQKFAATGLIHRNVADYSTTLKPIKYPDRVTVLHKLRSKPKADTDHFILDVLILSELHRRVAARCVEDIVIYDYKAAKKSSMKPFMVEKLQETFELQERAKEKYGNKALELIRRVQALEKSSWDRPDAKEDFGSANP